MWIKRKSWLWSILTSVALHVVLFGALIWFVIDRTTSTSAPDRPPTGAAEVSGSDAAPADNKDRVLDALARQDEKTSRMSPDERAAELKKKAARLKEISATSIARIATLAENIKGVDRSRAYVPQEGATGRFDAGSAVPYDFTREEKEGKTVYVRTMVDKDGRVLKCRIPAARMTAEDLREFRIYDMSRDNPSLRRLIRAAIRIGDQELKKK